MSKLVKAAKVVGGVAGKIAAMTGMGGSHEEPKAHAVKKGKLPRKNKARMPRKQKKALAKAHRANP